MSTFVKTGLDVDWPQDAPALVQGETVGAYVLHEVVFRTGDDIVYSAHDALGATVWLREYFPVKVVRRVRLAGGRAHVEARPEQEDTWRLSQRAFLDDARTQAGIDHSAVQRVNEVLHERGTAFVVSPALPGRAALAAVPGRSGAGISAQALERWLASLLGAVAAWHSRVKFHGAISPSTVWLLDDGSACLLAPRSGGRVIAERFPDSPGPWAAGYAALEQYTGEGGQGLGPWTDIYGLAAVVYTMLAGSAPPSAPRRCVRDELLALGNQDIPGFAPEFLRAIDAGLALKADQRPQSVAEWASLLALTPVVARGVTLAPVVGEAVADVAPEESAAPAAIETPPPNVVAGRNTRAWPLVAAGVAVVAVVASLFWWLSPVPTPVTPVARVEPAPPAPQPPVVTQEVQPMPVEPQPQPEFAPEPESVAATPVPVPAPEFPAGASTVSPGPSAQAQPPSPAAPPPEVPVASAVNPVIEAPAVTQAEAVPPLEAQAPKDLRPVAVRLQVSPWGEVFVNGSSRGVTPPLRELSLAPGNYRISIRNAGLPPHEVRLQVVAGKPAVIVHRFE